MGTASKAKKLRQQISKTASEQLLSTGRERQTVRFDDDPNTLTYLQSPWIDLLEQLETEVLPVKTGQA